VDDDHVIARNFDFGRRLHGAGGVEDGGGSGR
ncbi:MAG: hypothetical protein ACI9MB_003094, partial [Verrucomicrobiales bacterium]